MIHFSRFLVLLVILSIVAVDSLRTHVAQDPELPIPHVTEVLHPHNTTANGAINVSSLVNDESEVANTIVIVEFYTSWCFWCRQFTPVLSILASAAAESKEPGIPNVIFAKMNLEDSSTTPVKIRYDVMFFPTIVMILPNGTEHVFPEEEERSSENIVKFVLQYSGHYIRVPEAAPHVLAHSPGTSLKLDTNHTFEHVIYDVKKDVAVFFTAPWCSMCEAMYPMWQGLAESQSSVPDIIIAEVDVEVLPDVAEHFRVDSLPSIMLFTKKDKSGTLVYHGDDDVPSIEQWLLRSTSK
jgi:thioredoxin-like negative regulator of GroEL